MEMENSEKDISLREDKALVEALFSKESLMQFNENQQQSHLLYQTHHLYY